jgi:K+-sensing histidine kinase KdpD
VVYWELDLHRGRPPILRYGFSVVCVAIALGLALAFQYYKFRNVELPVLALSVGIATWYAGVGPSVLAVVLSAASFAYFFTEPIYSFEISPRDLPYFLVFVGRLGAHCRRLRNRPTPNRGEPSASPRSTSD